MRGPYIGPRPFGWNDGEDAKRFFGRDVEASELRFRVHANPVLLLYAQSGAGKTSLLNAKLIPELTTDGFSVLPPVRFKTFSRAQEHNQWTHDPYLGHIIHSWSEAIRDSAGAATSIPTFLRERLDTSTPTSLSGLSELLLDQEDQSQIVIIFDQFEELLSKGGGVEQHERFFVQVAECVEKIPSVRFVFALRSEWLALFDKYASKIPTSVRSRFYLEQLRSEAAEEAIIKPAALFGWTFDKQAAQTLTRRLRDPSGEVSADAFETEEAEFIEPVQLQIVCQDLWERVEIANAANKTILEGDIGSVGDPLAEYYAKAVAYTAQVTHLKEGRIRDWIARNLITEARTRGSVFKGATKTGGIINRVPDELEKARLVRCERRSGSWFELVHDSFITPILESNAKWRLQLSGAELFAQELSDRAQKRATLECDRDNPSKTPSA